MFHYLPLFLTHIWLSPPFSHTFKLSPSFFSHTFSSLLFSHTCSVVSTFSCTFSCLSFFSCIFSCLLLFLTHIQFPPSFFSSTFHFLPFLLPPILSLPPSPSPLLSP